MTSRILNKFSQRMKNLKPGRRRRFLHGVYKQLAESNRGRQADGEYRTARGQYHPVDEERVKFIFDVADALRQYGLENQANRLLEQEGKTEGYRRWRHTLNELERVDPESRRNIELRFDMPNGIQLDVGGFRQGEPFCASIVLHGFSDGREENLYQIRSVFGRIVLRRVGDYTNDLGWLTLEDALLIAQAAQSRDRQRYNMALQRVNAA